MKTREISSTVVRRLAVTRQGLAAPRRTADKEGVFELARELGCLQLDPISAVTRSHLLVLWSRLGEYDAADLDRLMWDEKRLFEYWAHCASIVLTEDYPIHNLMMRNYSDEASWSERTRKWVSENAGLRDYILAQLRERGPLLSRQLEDVRVSDWESSGWTDGRNVSRMLGFLWLRGVLMVAGRVGGQKLWDLAERTLPEWTPREELDEREVVRRAAQRSLRALGVARPGHINQHFTRSRYPKLAGVLAELEKEGRLEKVKVVGDEGGELPGPWYIHVEDLPLLERIEAGEWEGRTTLLSPFDNLICDRKRTEMLFDFYFRIEIYVPKEKRQYGYYVLPILQGDRLIGRVDPLMNRKAKRLEVNAVHSEAGVSLDGETGRGVRCAIEELGAFLGAREIAFGNYEF